MAEAQWHPLLAWAVIGVGLLTALVLRRVVAPYGRHLREGWGPTLPSRAGWVLMESPAVFVFGLVWAAGARADQAVPLLLLGVWMLHYVHRALIFPFRLRVEGKRIPLAIVLGGIVFNTVNAVLNARQVSMLGDYTGWLEDPRLWAGLGLFGVGLVVNLHADGVLIRLRAQGQGYQVPVGGLYRWVSCPNYLGELLEWLGWAVATWSLAGLSFAVFTATNLGPRAMAHHRWYRQTFPEYPPERRALIPGLW